MHAAACIPMRVAVLRRTTVAVVCGGAGRVPAAPSLARWPFVPHSGRAPERRLSSSSTDRKSEDAIPPEVPEDKHGDVSDDLKGGASAEPSGEPPAAEEAAPIPVVLFKAPSISQHFAEAEQMVDYSAVGSGVGLSVALLGVAPFTAPNTFMVAMMLAVFQVRLAHTWQTRVLRAQARRHVEEVVLVEPDRISIRSGCNLERTLHLNSDAASGERPPLSEVMRHGGPFIFLDRSAGTIDDPDALEALLASDRSIASEDLAIKTFEGESQHEADQVVQSLAKIKSKELNHIAKQQEGGKGPPPPRAAIGQAARSAQAVGATILLAGGVIGVSGQRQANTLPPGAIPLA